MAVAATVVIVVVLVIVVAAAGAGCGSSGLLQCLLAFPLDAAPSYSVEKEPVPTPGDETEEQRSFPNGEQGCG